MRAAALALVGVALASGACRRGARFSQRGDAASVVVVAPGPALASGLQAVEEREPNDAPAAATLLTLERSGVRAGATGALGEGDAADLFRVQIPPDPGAADGATGRPTALRLSAVVEAQGQGTVLELGDGLGARLVTSAGPPAERHGVPNAAVVAGASYLIRLAPADPKGPPTRYALTVALHQLEGGDEREPNDTPETATQMPPLATLPEAAGLAGWAGDVDHYRLELPAEDTAPLAIAVELEGVPAAALALELRAFGGRVLGRARAPRGGRAVLRNLFVPLAPLAAASNAAGPSSDAAPPAAAALHLVVKAEKGGRELERPYVVRVRPEAAGPAEQEPNDESAFATALVAEVPTVGHLTADDVDTFSISPPTNAVTDVTLEPPPGLDVSLQVADERGRLLMRSEAAGRGAPERALALGAVAGTTLFLRVSARKGTANGDEPYRLYARTRAAGPTDEREPNGSAALALALPPAAAGSGQIAAADDVDIWRIAHASGLASVRVTGPPGLDVRVADAESGKELARFRTEAQEAVKVLPRAVRALLVSVRAAVRVEPGAPYTVEGRP